MALLQACGPVALPLLLVGLSVVAVGVERGLFWWRWWKPPVRGRSSSRQRLLASGPEQRAVLLRRQHLAMAQGEPLLQAAVLVAPMLGLLGTVLGLMAVLRSLGPQLLLPASNPLVGYADVLASTVVGLLVALLALVLALLNQGLRQWQLQSLELLSLEAQP